VFGESYSEYTKLITDPTTLGLLDHALECTLVQKFCNSSFFKPMWHAHLSLHVVSPDFTNIVDYSRATCL
jgi:hypothetical protein